MMLTAMICTGSQQAKTTEKKAITNKDAKKNKKESRQWHNVKMRITAYCPCKKCCGKYADGVTASGHKIQPGDVFVAADSKYPFETEMIIPGYNNGKAVNVLDRGGAINGNRIDVFFPKHQQALSWGVKYMKVKIRTPQ